MVQNGVSRSAGKNAVDTATSKAKRPSRRGLQGSADQRLRRTPGRRHTFRTNEMTDISLRMQPVQSAAPRHVNADVMSRSPLSPPDRQKYGRLTEGYFPAERLRPCGKYNRDSRNGKSVKSPRILPNERNDMRGEKVVVEEGGWSEIRCPIPELVTIRYNSDMHRFERESGCCIPGADSLRKSSSISSLLGHPKRQRIA